MRSKNKKKRLKKTFPCKCGHIKGLHDNVDAPIHESWCNGMSEQATGIKGYKIRDICECERFVPDNLKYLEQRAKEKGKG